MGNVVGGLPVCPAQTAYERRATIQRLTATFGASGAIDSQSGTYGVTLTKSDTGVYALVYPACVAVDIIPVSRPAAGRGYGWDVIAKTPTSGTATLSWAPTDTEADPASGDSLDVIIIGYG